MRVYVTGISGYVGLRTAVALAERGHVVGGLVRNQYKAEEVLAVCPEASLDIGDLRRPGHWRDRIRSMEAVVHLAAQKNGNLHEQLAGTASTTESLLDALGPTWTGRFVLASSFAVYDYRRLRRGDVLTEESPLHANVFEAAPYSQGKRLQEDLVAEFGRSGLSSVAILRVAGVYGRGPAWSSGVAIRFSDSLGIMFAPRSPTKLVHVDNVAEACELAIRVPLPKHSVVNIVDDARPTFRELASGLRRAGLRVPRTIPVPFAALSIGERLLSLVAPVQRLYSTRLEILTEGGVRASWLPLKYSNARAKALLGWQCPDRTEQAYREAAIAEAQ